MAAPGGGGGGGGAMPPGMAGVLRHMLPIDEGDYDCSIELVPPGYVPPVAPADGAAEESSEGRPAKRAKLNDDIAAQFLASDSDDEPEVVSAEDAASAAAAAVVTCRASSVALKQHSEMFRSAVECTACADVCSAVDCSPTA